VVTGTFRYANTYPTAINLVACKNVQVEAIIDARFPLERSEEALRAGERDPSLLKRSVEVGKG
jgi:L-iditol 2-dehydrogenase